MHLAGSSITYEGLPAVRLSLCCKPRPPEVGKCHEEGEGLDVKEDDVRGTAALLLRTTERLAQSVRETPTTFPHTNGRVPPHHGARERMPVGRTNPGAACCGRRKGGFSYRAHDDAWCFRRPCSCSLSKRWSRWKASLTSVFV